MKRRRRDEQRQGRPRRVPSPGGLHPPLAHRRVPLDIVDDDNRLIDQDTDGQCQTPDGHGVECIAGKVQADQRRQHRNNDGEHDDQRRGQSPQHCQHNQSGKHGTQTTGDHQSCDAFSYLDRLVHHGRHAEVDHQRIVGAVRASALVLQTGGDLGQLLANAVHDLQRVCAGLPVDRHVHQTPAVDADDVRLDLPRIFHASDVAKQDRLTVATGLDGSIVQRLNLVGDGVGVDVELFVLDLGAAGGNQHVLPPQRLMHVQHGQVVGLQLLRFHVSQNPPQRPTIDGRGDYAADRLQIVPQVFL